MFGRYLFIGWKKGGGGEKVGIRKSKVNVSKPELQKWSKIARFVRK